MVSFSLRGTVVTRYAPTLVTLTHPELVLNCLRIAYKRCFTIQSLRRVFFWFEELIRVKISVKFFQNNIILWMSRVQLRRQTIIRSNSDKSELSEVLGSGRWEVCSLQEDTTLAGEETVFSALRILSWSKLANSGQSVMRPSTPQLLRAQHTSDTVGAK